MDDATGWCILAYIVLLIRSSHNTRQAWITVVGVVFFILIMTIGVQGLLRRFETIFKRRGALGYDVLALLLVLVLVSALCTEWLGIHLLLARS